MSLCLHVGEEHAADWSYPVFNRLRRMLAQADGIDLDTMAGWGEPYTPWDAVDTVLRPLLDHPDNAGELSAADCAVLAPRVREVLETWPGYDPYRGFAKMLARTLEQAAAAGAPLTFR